jgi:hypothetical protein
MNNENTPKNQALSNTTAPDYEQVSLDSLSGKTKLNFNFSVLTATTPQNKVFSLENGKLKKSSSVNPYAGNFQTVSIDSLDQFANGLTRLNAKQSLVLGTIKNTTGKTLTAGESIGLCTKGKEDATHISKTLDFISYTETAGFMLVDIDQAGHYTDFLNLVPEIKAAVIKPSSSSFVYDSNGNEIIGAKGWHIFIPVANQSQIPAIAELLWQRQWLKGYGHYLLSAGVNPALLERGLFDKAVFSPERLIFEAKPTLNSGLVQNAPAPIVIGTIDQALKLSDFVTYSKADLAKIEELKQAAKEAVRPAQNVAIKQAKRDYIKKSGLPAKVALTNYKQISKGVLTHDFEVITQKFGKVKIADLLANPKKFNNCTLADPNDPDYDGGSLTKAKFYFNNGINPTINSQAHGGIVYRINTELSFINSRHNVTKVNERYLNAELKAGVNIIKSIQGSGKTFGAIKFVKSHPDLSVLYLAHLIVLCKQAANKFEIESYDDPKLKGKIHDIDRLAMCLNSLVKLIKDGKIKPFDVLIIDEIEQLLSRLVQTGAGAVEDKVGVFDCLKYLIKSAKTLVCLDADVSKTTLDFIEAIRPNEAFNITVNDYQHKGKKLFIYENEADVLKLVQDAVNCNAPVLFAHNAKEAAEKNHNLIECEDSEKRIISSRTSGNPENIAFCADIDSECKNDLLTVITPSVSTGFSIESGHYKLNAGVFSHLVNNPLDCLQQLERDRKTMDKHIFVSSVRRFYKRKDTQAAYKVGENRIDDYGNVVKFDPIYSQLFKNVTERERLLKSDFKASLIKEAKAKGYEVIEVKSSLTEDDLLAAKKANKKTRALLDDERIERLLAAPRVDADKYDSLCRKPFKTEQDWDSIEHSAIANFYEQDITKELVIFDNKGKTRQQIKLLDLATGTLENAKRNQIGYDTGKFKEDSNHAIIQFYFFSRLLMAIGVDVKNLESLKGKFFYNAEQVEPFLRHIDRYRAVYSVVLDVPKLDYMLENPFFVINQFLKKCGFKLIKKVKWINGKTERIGFNAFVSDSLLDFLINKRNKKTSKDFDFSGNENLSNTEIETYTHEPTAPTFEPVAIPNSAVLSDCKTIAIPEPIAVAPAEPVNSFCVIKYKLKDGSGGQVLSHEGYERTWKSLVDRYGDRLAA